MTGFYGAPDKALQQVDDLLDFLNDIEIMPVSDPNKFYAGSKTHRLPNVNYLQHKAVGLFLAFAPSDTQHPAFLPYGGQLTVACSTDASVVERLPTIWEYPILLGTTRLRRSAFP